MSIAVCASVMAKLTLMLAKVGMAVEGPVLGRCCAINMSRSNTYGFQPN